MSRAALPGVVHLPLGLAFMLAVLASPPASAGVHGESLTTNKMPAASLVQNAFPRFDQRGTEIDGTVRSGSAMGLQLGANPFGEGWNRNIVLNDPSAHAEILALRDAGARLVNYRFPGATLYATLEPCAMCAMALVHARVARVVFAADDPKTGAAGSVFDTLVSERHNHRIDVERGLLANASATLLREFFRARR